jgi:transposase
MVIELTDDDTRLLYRVLLQQAQEHLSYADTSEVAERLYKLATRFERPVRELPI